MNAKSSKQSAQTQREAVPTIIARLIEAQEREGTRIARELHDDIGASLAVLAVELLSLGNPVSGAPERVSAGISEIYEKMQKIAKQVSRLSHRLHSPVLEYMGVAKALQVECRESSERFGIPVAFSGSDIPPKLDPAVGLTCLRVVQEALHNAAQHSGATKIEVEVRGTPILLTLRVRDNGKGLDPEQSRLTPGVGLILMRERMCMIGGEFEIRSQPNQGTEVICRVPLGNEQQGQRDTESHASESP